MKIKDVVCAAGSTGFYFDDQRAIKRGAGHDGMFYIGQPVTEGFSAVRMKGEAVSVMIVLEDGQIAFGDCAAVQYSGAGGRDPLFLAKDFIPIIEQYVRPMLLGREADDFRGLCAQMEAIEVNGKRLHTAIRYGVSQAILDAVAKATGRLMCEVVADEYGCTVSQTPIPIFTQSGDDRYDNADKMIIKRAQVLPHALINNVQTKLGEHGEKLLEYVKWLRDRILTMRADESYQPVLHIDVYGTIGAAFGNNNYAAMADYLAELEQAAKPFHLVRIGRTTHLGAHVDQRQTHHVAQKNIVRNNQYPVHKTPSGVCRCPAPAQNHARAARGQKNLPDMLFIR